MITNTSKWVFYILKYVELTTNVDFSSFYKNMFQDLQKHHKQPLSHFI
jgi:hypothetical protein